MNTKRIKLGCYFRFLREENNASLFKLARKANISKSSLSRYENSISKIPECMAKIIANSFSVDFLDSDQLNEQLDNELSLIVHQFIMFDYEWCNRIKVLDRHIKRIKATSNYPIYVLIKYFVYSLRNDHTDYTAKYSKLLENILISFTEKEQAIFYVAKLGQLYFAQKYDEALTLYLDTISKFDLSDELLSLVCNIVMLIYSTLGELKPMFSYLNQSRELSLKMGNLKRVVNLNISQGNFYRRMRLFNAALHFDLENLAFSEKYDVQYNKATILQNIAVTYFWLGDYKNSANYYEQTILETSPTNGICFYLAHCYFLLGNYKKCREYIARGKSASLSKPIFNDLLEWIEAMANKRYSGKAKRILLKCHKLYYHQSHVQTKEFLLNLLINQFTYENDHEKVVYYQTILDELIESIKLKT